MIQLKATMAKPSRARRVSRRGWISASAVPTASAISIDSTSGIVSPLRRISDTMMGSAISAPHTRTTFPMMWQSNRLFIF